MKKVFSVLLCLSILIMTASMSASAENEKNNTAETVKTQETQQAQKTQETQKTYGSLPVEVKAKAVVLMDQTTGKVLMKMNENEKLPPASVTKIMTLLLVVEAIDNNKIRLTDTVTVSANAASKGGSQIWLKEGETMTVDEMLKAAAVYSANDACTALGEYIAGSEEGFVLMLNERAEELGMVNTNFENCTGLDDDTTNHLTTAYDIALMSRELMKHDIIQNYTTIWMDSLRNGQTELVNTNKLIRFYSGATGLKTGTTSKAGCCISATATRDGTSLIAVVLGADNSADRFEGAKAMLNWGFANYSTVTPTIDKSLITDVNVLMGEESTITPQIPSATTVLVPKGKEKDIVQDVELTTAVEAPVESNQTLGTVTIKLDGEVLGTYKLTAPHYVEKLSFLVVFKRMLGSICKN
jgi:D-alanyl-D-alanine carboxypeptidase (penicillin-binding protein 5/6)